MAATEWITLGLAMLTGIYVVLVFIQMKRFRKFTLKQIRYQVEGDITQLRIKKAELEFNKGLKAEARTILNDREEQCKKTVCRVVEELGNLDKEDNWVTDPKLNWSEKTFHGLVFVFGILLLIIVSKLLWDVGHRDIQGAGSIALIVVFMLLIMFSFFCISGRGVDILEQLRKKIIVAESIEFYGFAVKVPPKPRNEKGDNS